MRSTENEQIAVTVMATPVERQGGMRLNTTMKQQVVEKALEHAFGRRQAALLKEQHAVSKLCWLNKFGAAKLKHALALGAPFVVVDEGRGHVVNWRVGGQVVPLPTLQPTPFYGFRDASFLTVTDEAIVRRCRALQDDMVAFTAERDKVTGTLTGMLANISTFNSLEKNWPEGNQFYKHLPTAFPFRHQVPAVLVSELNAALGI